MLCGAPIAHAHTDSPTEAPLFAGEAWGDGTWEDRTWGDGTWDDRTWEDRTWEDRTWDDGTWDDWPWDDGDREDWPWEDWSWAPWSPDDGSSESPAEPPRADDPLLADEPPPADEAQADEPLADATTLAGDVLAAPTLTVSGTTLKWVPSVATSSYVFVRKVPDLEHQYSIVTGTSLTPPAAPGKTVNYSVRANVSGSAWAREVSITYPATTSPGPNTAAPRLSASGTTLNWTRVASVNNYLLRRRMPDGSAQTSQVSGLTTTPTAAPGKTVRYSVRTDITGSVWSGEVAIAYPASSPPPAPTPSPTGFRMGVVAGSALSYELSFIRSLGARTARLEFGIGASASSMASVIDQYARAGVRPLLLAGFHGRLPSTSEAQNLANWAKAYGPGGTFWQGKSYPANTAVTQIEFGNETSYSYQFSDYSLGTYSARAQTYAQRAREAATAITAANRNVGLLAIGDNAVNQQAWVINMFRAVPNLDDLVSGWTIHPYGPNWASRMDSTVNSTRTAGARDLPMWITEWGLSTDNGRCLDDNYGFGECMTYSEAGTTLNSVLNGMQSRYGNRLGAFYLYQAHDQATSGTTNGRERYFGALQSNGTAKGAYTTAVRARLAASP